MYYITAQAGGQVSQVAPPVRMGGPLRIWAKEVLVLIFNAWISLGLKKGKALLKKFFKNLSDKSHFGQDLVRQHLSAVFAGLWNSRPLAAG